MIQRAPAWTWITLAIIVGAFTLFGIVTLVPGGDTEATKAAPAEALSTTGRIVLTEERQYITLLGPDKLAGPVDLDALRAGECPRWLPPAGTIVRYEDGFEVSAQAITTHPSIGLVWFKGPTGQQVGIRKTTDCS